MMHPATKPLTRAAVIAGLAGLIATPAAAVNIPEGGAVTPDSVFVINFQVQEGCDGAPTDALEVTIPDSVQGPLPESVSGWDVTVENMAAGGDDGEQTVVRWSGGPLPDGTFKEFGLRARFPDDPGATIAFPVVQRCGETELAWTDESGDMAAPMVTLSERFGPRDIADLDEPVAQLQTQLDELTTQLGSVDAANLRSRVSDAEGSLKEIMGRLDGIDEQLGQLAGSNGQPEQAE